MPRKNKVGKDKLKKYNTQVIQYENINKKFNHEIRGKLSMMGSREIGKTH